MFSTLIVYKVYDSYKGRIRSNNRSNYNVPEENETKEEEEEEEEDKDEQTGITLTHRKIVQCNC